MILTHFNEWVSLRSIHVGKMGAILMAFLLISAGVQASLVNFTDSIQNPTDNGAGPVIWYQTSAAANSGSAASTLTASMGDARTDFFGNADNAFARPASSTAGAGISGSADTGFAAGDNGTVVMTFQTPETLASNASLFSRGPFNSPPNFELFFLTSNSRLRLGFDNQQNTFLPVVSSDTWYYFAVSWDTSLPDNQVSWYLGEMADVSSGLTSGTITAGTIGNTNSSIYIAGRSADNQFLGAYQNVAIYDRTLTSDAINAQFAAIPEPSSLAMIGIGVMLALRFLRRRAIR